MAGFPPIRAGSSFRLFTLEMNGRSRVLRSSMQEVTKLLITADGRQRCHSNAPRGPQAANTVANQESS